MKSSNISRFKALKFALVALCAIVSIASISRADVEMLREQVSLVSGTTISGDASLEAAVVSGTTSATLDLAPDGLTSGTYNVTATLKSGTDQVLLGSFEVVDSGTSTTLTGTDSSPLLDNEVVFGGTDGIPLPQDLNPFNIATITISGTDNVAVLTADFTNVSDIAAGRLHVVVSGTGGVAAPTATGHLVVNARVHRGRLGGLFNLVGHNLPGKTMLELAINGTDVRAVRTDRRGNLHVIAVLHGNAANNHKHSRQSPINAFGTEAISIHYPNGGQDVLDVNF